MNTTEENVHASISSIYADLLNRRRSEKIMQEEQKRMEKELKESKEEEDETVKLSKKEKRQKELDAWKEIVIGLTGDDLEYSSKKSKKKKYKKWISDDDFETGLTVKPKKPKKRNYNKEFEPELNMLRTLVAEQNRFTADLQKRFQNAAGPAVKDGLAPNKTLVELANVIASGRSNSLGMLREIGNLKKTIADLYMKQKKLDADLSNVSSFDGADVGLMGSNIASNLFSDNPFMSSPQQGGGGSTPDVNNTTNNVQYIQNNPAPQNSAPQVFEPQGQPVPQTQTVEQFDPSSWTGPDLGNSYSLYESIPHTVVVQRSNDGNMRFAAIRDDNGEELSGCPLPTADISRLKINEQDRTVRGEFDEVYKLIDV